MKRRFLPVLLATSILGSTVPWPRAAWAQERPAIGDEVKLIDGSLFRGTLVEVVPNDHVTLLLPSGETRRFAWADVEHQGPVPTPPAAASPAPAPSSPPPSRPEPSEPEPAITVKADKVDVHVASDQDDVALLYRGGQAEFGARGTARHFQLICNAPCDAQLPVGVHRLALSHGGGRALETEHPVHLDEPSTLRVHYTSKKSTRILGWVVLGGSEAVGMAVLIAGLMQTTEDCSSGMCLNMPSPNGGLMVAGVGVMIAGGLLSLAFVLQHDKAHIEVVPQGTSRMIRLPGSSLESVALTPSDAPGMGVRVRF
jgi:hypothetical protein